MGWRLRGMMVGVIVAQMKARVKKTLRVWEREGFDGCIIASAR
jgi:hypothetical protein